MNGIFNIDKFDRIVNSSIVPMDCYGGKEFQLDDMTVSINATHLNSNYTFQEKSILVTLQDNSSFYFTSSEKGVDVFYWDSIDNEFGVMDNYVSKEKSDLAHRVWNTVYEEISILELSEGANIGKLSFYRFRESFQDNMPPALYGLFLCNKFYGAEGFGQGFEINVFDWSWYIKMGLSFEASLLFMPFAHMNKNGDIYAFWKINDDLNCCPILGISHRGEVKIICNNISELVNILALDKQVYFTYSDLIIEAETCSKASTFQSNFVAWVEDTFGACDSSVRNIMDKMLTAQNQFQHTLESLMKSLTYKKRIA